MILVDSSVWVEYFRGTMTRQTARLDLLLGRELLAIGDLILTRVLQGFDNDRQFLTVQRLLTSLLVVEMGGQDIALQSARNYRLLRRRGITIRKTIDTIIATRCIESGYDLLHSDRDFDPFSSYLRLSVVSC